MPTKNDFEYKIIKRKAIRIEDVPPKKMARYKHTGSIHEVVQQPNRRCVRCGQEAKVVALFKVDRKGTVLREKYCDSCLKLWVYL